MSQSTTMTIRLEPDLKSRLDQLAEVTHRSKSFLAAEAIREFIEINEWQIQEIKQAIKEADEGDFASDKEVQTVMRKWGVNGD
jgi:RHH-type transcriptional regulator, rel operon repressor / antitoxin RelB